MFTIFKMFIPFILVTKTCVANVSSCHQWLKVSTQNSVEFRWLEQDWQWISNEFVCRWQYFDPIQYQINIPNEYICRLHGRLGYATAHDVYERECNVPRITGKRLLYLRWEMQFELNGNWSGVWTTHCSVDPSDPKIDWPALTLSQYAISERGVCIDCDFRHKSLMHPCIYINTEKKKKIHQK